MFTIEIYTLGELLPVFFSLEKEDYYSAIDQFDRDDLKFISIEDYYFNKQNIVKMRVGAKVDIL